MDYSMTVEDREDALQRLVEWGDIIVQVRGDAGVANVHSLWAPDGNHLTYLVECPDPSGGPHSMFFGANGQAVDKSLLDPFTDPNLALTEAERLVTKVS